MKLTRQRYFPIDGDRPRFNGLSIFKVGRIRRATPVNNEKQQSYDAWSHTPVGWLDELPEYEIPGTLQGLFAKANSKCPSGFLKCSSKHTCRYRVLHMILRTSRFGD